MNYAELLRKRAEHAHPREAHEETASFMQERNAEALAYWKIRWGLRAVFPDAVTPQWRDRLDALYTMRRLAAREWLRWRWSEQWPVVPTHYVTSVVPFRRKSP